MSEKNNIDARQQEIKSLEAQKESPQKLREKLQQYRATLVSAVDQGQRELQSAAAKLKSDEAKTYLKSGANKVAGFLDAIAAKGQEILSKSKDKKKVGEEHYGTIESHSSSLQKELNEQKKAIESFKILEEIEKKDIVKIQEQNDKINEYSAETDPEKVKKEKLALSAEMRRLQPKFKGHPASQTYLAKVRDKFQKLEKQIKDEAMEVDMNPIYCQKEADEKVLKPIQNFLTLAKSAEQQPTMRMIEMAKAFKENLKLQEVIDSVMDEYDAGTFSYTKNYRVKLQKELDQAKKDFEEQDIDLDKLEKKALNDAAEKAVEKITQLEDSEIKDTWGVYEKLAKQEKLSKEELKDLQGMEKGLLQA
ncbi:hypothetical protein GF376_03360, partial [Candidatus Peregrinibacteria bacterium]|nr:hypothetical protein [Candidatus Peregrinibacteria bacterium]